MAAASAPPVTTPAPPSPPSPSKKARTKRIWKIRSPTPATPTSRPLSSATSIASVPAANAWMRNNQRQAQYASQQKGRGRRAESRHRRLSFQPSLVPAPFPRRSAHSRRRHAAPLRIRQLRQRSTRHRRRTRSQRRPPLTADSSAADTPATAKLKRGMSIQDVTTLFGPGKQLS